MVFLYQAVSSFFLQSFSVFQSPTPWLTLLLWKNRVNWSFANCVIGLMGLSINLSSYLNLSLISILVKWGMGTFLNCVLMKFLIRVKKIVLTKELGMLFEIIKSGQHNFCELLVIQSSNSLTNLNFFCYEYFLRFLFQMAN